MARVPFETVAEDRAGNVIQNARVILSANRTNTPVTDAYPSDAGGVAQSEFVSNADGLVKCWFDEPKFIRTTTTNNGGTAFYPGAPGVFLPFPNEVKDDVRVLNAPVRVNDEELVRFVNGGGSDDNDGFERGSAFLTIDAAKTALAETGGRIVCGYKPAGYDPFILDINKRFIVDFQPGTWINDQPGAVSIDIQQESGADGAGCEVLNPWVKGTHAADSVAARFHNTDRAIIKNFRFDDIAVGVRWESADALPGKAGQHQAEHCGLRDGWISGATFATDTFKASGPSASFADAFLDNVGLRNCDTYVHQQADTSLYRSRFNFTAYMEAGQTAVDLKGDIKDAVWHVGFEDFDAAGTIGVFIDSTCVNYERFQLFANFTGFTAGTKVFCAGTTWLRYQEGGYVTIVGDGSRRFARYYNDGADFPAVEFVGQMPGGGGVLLSDGTGAADVNLYRNAVNQLKTDDKFLAALGIGVGNALAATTPGAVVKKMEVFDAAGASLGFVPIYAAIV